MHLLDLHQRFRRYLAIEEGLSVKTVRAMQSSFKTFLRRSNAEKIGDMTLELLQGFFYEGKEKYQWSYWHYSNHHKYLSKFLDWCVKEGFASENPVKRIKKPHKPQNLPRRLTLEEGQKLLYAAFNCDWRYSFERSRNHAIIGTFLFAGLRCEELLRLEMTDINLNAGSILVRGGKGNKDRYVPIHNKLHYILRRYLEDREKAGKKTIFLFTGVLSDKPLTHKAIYRICRKIARDTGVRFTPHCLRHTFASVAIEQNVGLVQVKEMLGHNSIVSTMIYLKMSPQGLKEGLNKVEMF